VYVCVFMCVCFVSMYNGCVCVCVCVCVRVCVFMSVKTCIMLFFECCVFNDGVCVCVSVWGLCVLVVRSTQGTRPGREWAGSCDCVTKQTLPTP